MTAKLNAAEIAEARELCEKATKGPWEVFYWDGHYNLHGGDVGDCGGDPEDGWGCVYGYAQRDGINLGKIAGAEERAAFIAASRTGWPAALDALEEANRALAQSNSDYQITVRQMRVEQGRVVEAAELIHDRTAERDAALERADKAEGSATRLKDALASVCKLIGVVVRAHDDPHGRSPSCRMSHALYDELVAVVAAAEEASR